MSDDPNSMVKENVDREQDTAIPYDEAFKKLLEVFFKEFIELFFPELDAVLDYS